MLDKIKSLRPEDGNILAKFVKEAADARGSGLKSRADLFYQTEPFARELDQYGLADPGDRGNRASFTISNRLTAIGGKQQLVKYRAMLFAWLSYYHPDEARSFCKRVGVDLPFYDGHPDLRDCSQEAVDWFFKQEREAQSDEEETAPLAVATGAEGSAESESLIEQEEPKPSKQDSQKPIIVEDQSKEDKGNKRMLVVAGSLGALLLLGTAITAALNPSLFGIAPKEDQEPTEASPPSLATNDDPMTPEETSEDQGGDKNEDAEPTKTEAEDEPVAATPEPPRQINRVWDEISQAEWSTRVLRYFYPFISRSNRTDLMNAAAAGNANAQTLAGIGFYTGRLGRPDYSKSLTQYLRPACDAGQGRACALIAVHYRLGRGVPANDTTAARFYARGCQFGNQIGCHYEAVRVYYGQGVPQNIPRALQTFERTCDAGVSYSCYLLALSYLQGASVEQNIETARRYYERSRVLEAPDRSPPFDEAFRITAAN
ncbi:MAG: tetratricopeptide repeat protein [Pseudomonadota bacterium]